MAYDTTKKGKKDEVTISEIKGKISKFRNDTTWMQTRARWDTDFDLWRLLPYNAGKGYYSYTTNAPGIFCDKLISMLIDSKLLIRVPPDSLRPEEREMANNVERFLYGAFNMNDERLMLIPDMVSLRAAMAWYAIVRGGFANLAYVYKNEEGKTIPHVAIWDIYNTCYGVGKNGLAWASHTRKATRAEVESSYNFNPGQDEIDVIDYWTEKYNCIVVGSKWGKHMEDHDAGECPVSIIRVGSTPVVWQQTYQYTGKHIGESALARNRDIYPIMNKTVSDLLTLVRRGVKVPIGIWSQGATKSIDEDIYQVEKAATVQLDLNDKVAPLIPPTMPPDAAALVNIVSGDTQRGSLPHTAYGEVAQRLSGFAINQLQGSMSTVIEPFVTAIEKAYKISCYRLLKQYAGSSFPPIAVRGRTSRNAAFGFPVAIEIAPDMIAGDWHPEISLKPVLPKDEAQNWIMANQARQGEVPLMSDRSIREEILEVQDAEREEELVSQEWGDRLIINRLYKAYTAAIVDGDVDVAQNILAELRRVMATMPQPQPMGAQGQMPPSVEAAAGLPGAGMPPGQTGVPSAAFPPEALGGLPPGALNARMPDIAQEL